jgi:hypothetical protein
LSHTGWDDSIGGQATDALIDRRIDNVMQFERVKAQDNTPSLVAYRPLPDDGDGQHQSRQQMDGSVSGAIRLTPNTVKEYRYAPPLDGRCRDHRTGGLSDVGDQAARFTAPQ